MKSCKPGSAILIVILIMSAVVLASFNLWKGTALTMDLVLKRQEQAQKAKIIEGVLNYGISLCMERFDSLLKQAKKEKKGFELSVGTWNIQGHLPYKGQLYLEVAGSTVRMSASLSTQQACSAGASCVLERAIKGKGDKKKHSFIIRDWKVHA